MTKNNPRIIAGTLKGSKLIVPESARPLTDRLKTILFDILGEAITDAKVLDVFAGSGNFGIEALSRGAQQVTFLDSDFEAIDVIKSNLERLKIQSGFDISRKDFRDFLDTESVKFDIIFCDPPFNLTLVVKPRRFIHLLKKSSILIIKIQTDKKDDFKIDEEFEVIKEKQVGINYLFFLRLK